VVSLSAKPKHKITKGLPADIRELADSGIDHLGTMLDNMKVSDWVDAAPYLAVAYLGYQAKNDPRDAAIAMVGLKLATSMGGTPPISQITGLAILSGMLIIPPLTNAYSEWAEKTKADIESRTTEKIVNDYKIDTSDSIKMAKVRRLAEVVMLMQQAYQFKDMQAFYNLRQEKEQLERELAEQEPSQGSAR